MSILRLIQAARRRPAVEPAPPIAPAVPAPPVVMVRPEHRARYERIMNEVDRLDRFVEVLAAFRAAIAHSADQHKEIAKSIAGGDEDPAAFAAAFAAIDLEALARNVARTAASLDTIAASLTKRAGAA